MIFAHKKIIFLAGILLLSLYASVCVAANVGDVVDFNVDKSFDASGRVKVSATLIKSTDNLYFYVEKGWWESQKQATKDSILQNLGILSEEFSSNIYPKLTSVYGSEQKPGIDNDNRITVLFEAMNRNEGGYFREADEYEKLQVPVSNEREMVYLSLDRISDPKLKIILAHEFAHLITFNQKNKNHNVTEDVWLNEARADYTSTILGYDDKYEGSNLQQRVNDFVFSPSDSITDWRGTKYDYASATMFTHYLVDRYGIDILKDSLKSAYPGVASVNYALQKAGATDDFSEVFENWMIAVVLNDCSEGQKYCYKNQHLRNFKLSSSLNFLPSSGNVSLSVTNLTKNWQGNWLKLIGGNGNLKLGFSGGEKSSFQVPYITEDSSGNKTLKKMVLDGKGNGEIKIDKFSDEYKSITIMPFLHSNTSLVNDLEVNYPFTYTVSVSQPGTEDDLIKKLLDQIASLKAQIAALLAQNTPGQTVACSITQNLSYGMSNSSVTCLQNFLKSQGTDIYPEGLVTGYFGSLTEKAVVKFQEKYASEILSPLGLYAGTGYVGLSTRNKINSLLPTR